MTTFRMDGTLSEAHTELKEQIANGNNVTCPCCGQNAKIYKRKIHSQMAKDLITIHKFAPAHPWVYAPAIIGAGGDFAKLRFWGLIEESKEPRIDGGRAGWWRITPTGSDFVRGTALVQSTALIYNADCLKIEGDWINIRDALGERFDFNQLMGR